MYNDDNKDSRETLSSRMRNYWGAFAHHGKPGKGLDGEGTQWSSWNNKSSDKFLVFDSKAGGGIRMAGEIVSLAGIEKDLMADDRLPNAEDKCGVLARLVKGEDDHWPASEYPQKVQGACAQYPL